MFMPRRALKILFCGHLNSIDNKGRQRCETLRELGLDVAPFDFHAYEDFSPLTRLIIRSNGGNFPKAAVASFNRDFLERIAAVKPDIVWLEKALLLLPETLAQAKKSLPNSLFVSYQTDNPFGHRRNEVPLWKNFIQCIPYYDLHFGIRNSDVQKFTMYGAKHVVVSRHGFFPPIHRSYRPGEVPDHLKHDTVFIGTAIDHRVGAISCLMTKERLRIDVYGGHWNRHLVYYGHRPCFHGILTTEYFALVVSGSKVCLGYVSSSNLDEYSGRSIEIPACGGFFLAERTPMHQELYQEGVEAEFFSSDEECADKIRFYLQNDGERQKIARAGYERCLKSDYSQARSMREAMREIFALRND